MNTASAIKSASLAYREGSSDKVYHASVEPKDSGFVVNFAYGRRGSTLQTGTKTQSPVDLAAATKIFNKIVAEKTAGGYSTDGSGVAFAGTANAGRVSGYVAQLVNEITLAEAEKLILNPDYVAQEKFYGERRMATTEGDAPQGMNRKGLFVPLQQHLADALAASIAPQSAIDAEEKREKLYVFDLLTYEGADLSELSQDERLSKLEDVLTPSTTVVLVPTARTTAEKRALFDRVKAENGEGLVFKLRSAGYKPGRPNSGGNWLKVKFKGMASFIVIGHNAQRSVEIAVIAKGKQRSVGNVTVPPDQAIPAIGAIVEVQYLYAMPGGGLL